MIYLLNSNTLSPRPSHHGDRAGYPGSPQHTLPLPSSLQALDERFSAAALAAGTHVQKASSLPAHWETVPDMGDIMEAGTEGDWLGWSKD